MALASTSQQAPNPPKHMRRGRYMQAMRANSTQKAYDEAFLACSTAVYFESQNNEPEALRSWKSALDQIYYHNAHRPPSNVRPTSETEKALIESLRQLELQCKERVDLLEALKRSREEAKQQDKANDQIGSLPPGADAEPPPPPLHGNPMNPADSPSSSNWLGGGTIPPVDYTDLSRPPLPQRPSLPARKSSGADTHRTKGAPQAGPLLYPASTGRKESRTPSPEKKGRLLRTLRPGRESKASNTAFPSSLRSRRPEAAKAATQAWSSKQAPSSAKLAKLSLSTGGAPSTPPFERPGSALDADNPPPQPPSHELHPPCVPFYFRSAEAGGSAQYTVLAPNNGSDPELVSKVQRTRRDLSSPLDQRNSLDLGRITSSQSNNALLPLYRNEYPESTQNARLLAASAAARSWADLESEKSGLSRESSVVQKPVHSFLQQPSKNDRGQRVKTESKDIVAVGEVDSFNNKQLPTRRKVKAKHDGIRADLPPTSTSDREHPSSDTEGLESDSDEWKERIEKILKTLPRGVDVTAARQILNEIVIQGDEVHWDDVAGLEVAKSALKETVVYPFLRPDLFMGLREPARGMLLFGPPGTGKTMLARAVATESRSTFFAISASSLTSKYLGESEKLVRALFALARLLAPSIIFVDEIDSLLSSRSGSGEHEATRRIKTEFLIQWSDLAKAAAGREQTEKDKEKGDATRVLVLAATNLPWTIDEAARRRFVRRQYIPLPENHVRKAQVKTLLSHQKHELNEDDLDRLVKLTEGFSGSDITALAKDAAMGPLRSLGERLLHMTMDEIRPIHFEDFEASLQTIRPSVSKQGLKQYEDWAREFGERGG